MKNLLFIIIILTGFNGITQNVKEVIKRDISKECKSCIQKRAYIDEVYTKLIKVINGVYIETNIAYAYENKTKIIYFLLDEDMYKRFQTDIIYLNIDGTLFNFESTYNFKVINTSNVLLEPVKTYRFGYKLSDKLSNAIINANLINIELLKTHTGVRKVWELDKGLVKDIVKSYNCFMQYASPIEMKFELERLKIEEEKKKEELAREEKRKEVERKREEREYLLEQERKKAEQEKLDEQLRIIEEERKIEEKRLLDYEKNLVYFEKNFRDSKWFDSKKQVKASQKSKPFTEQEDLLGYEIILNNKAYLTGYSFFKNQLYSGVYTRKNEFSSSNNSYYEYLEVQKILIAKYGSPKKINASTSIKKGTEVNEINRKIQNGEYIESTHWGTQNTTISLSISATNYDTSITIIYKTKNEDIKLKVAKAKTEKKMEGF